MESQPSQFLTFQICKTGEVTSSMRNAEWKTLQDAAEAGKKRPFFRAVANGLMFAGPILGHATLLTHLHLHLPNHTSDLYATGGLDVPIDRPLIKRDWRFGHYETEGLQDPVSKLVRLAITICTFGLLKRKGKNGGKKAEKDSRAVQNSGHRLPSGASSVGGKMDQDLVTALALEQ